jgi:hypothetical protein
VTSSQQTNKTEGNKKGVGRGGRERKKEQGNETGRREEGENRKREREGERERIDNLCWISFLLTQKIHILRV